MSDHVQRHSAAGSVTPETASGRAEQLAARTTRRPGRAAVIAARATIIVVSLALPLILLEVSLRMFGPWLPGNYDTGSFVQRHPLLGHFHRPNHTNWIKTPQFTVRMNINPMGLRDPRQTYAKPPGVFRILLLGDSYVEAAQVQAEDSISMDLERKLTASMGRPVEVINGGVFGYGTAQEYLLLDQEGVKYQPDLVVLFFCHCNDIPNNNYRLEVPDSDLSRALKPYFDLEDDSSELRLIPPPPPSARTTVRERLRDSSLLYNVIETGVVYKLELQNPREAFNAIGGLVEPTQGKYDARPRGEWERSWQITEGILAKMRERASEMGAPLVVVSIPEWRMLDRAYWQRDDQKRLVGSGRGGPDAQVRLLQGIAGRLNVPHLDLVPAYQPLVDKDGLFRYYIEGDYHWTAAGHAVAADAVSAFLHERGLTPR